MSIASAIANKQQQVADCYTAISNKGGTLPATQDVANMPTAINSISTGGTIDSLTITPTTSQQTITASGGTDGYSPITVNAVTSAIDANIQASNIKSGVTILSVTGNYGGGGSKYGCTIDNLLGDVDANGVLQIPANTSGNIVFTGVKNIVGYGLYYKYAFVSNLTNSVSFLDLEELTNDASMYYAFYSTKISSISLPKLKTVSGSDALRFFCGYTNITSLSLPELETVSGSNGMRNSFSNNFYLSSISLPKLKTVTGIYGIANLFYGCRLLTDLSLPELETASSNYVCYYLCGACDILETVNLPKLSNISGQYTFNYAFLGCPKLQHIYFNGLTTTSFGSYINQFNNMFNNQTGSTATGGCTVHFPSNLSSKIASLQGYPTFGGSSSYINLAFDLTATS